MKAVQISKPGGNFEIVERPTPQPARGEVRIKVEACGICHSDALVKEGTSILMEATRNTWSFPLKRSP